MIHRLLTLMFFLVFGSAIQAQQDYPATLLVEHFTNTNCPICAGQNPDLYQALDNYSGTYIHIAYHPPVPYEACQFYQYNPSENEARFDYYGLFSTPRVVLNGTASHPAGQIDEEDLEAYLDMQTTASIDVDLLKSSPFEVDITIETNGNYDPSNKRLYVLLAEKRVDYEAPNGEDVHRDVFRTFLTSSDGEILDIQAGDTADKTYSYTWDDTWEEDELYAAAFIQDHSTKEIVNASSSLSGATAIDNQHGVENLKLFPSPASDEIRIEGLDADGTLRIFDLNGRYQFQVQIDHSKSKSIDISALTGGVYIVLFSTDAGNYHGSFIKE